MQKNTETINASGLRRAAFCGLISAGILLLLLLAAAALAGTYVQLLTGASVTGKLCLTICALLCGLLSSRGGERDKAILALVGEAVLLAVISAAMLILGGSVFTLAWLIDVGCLIFGAFAGTLLGSRRRRGKRRRK